MSSARHLLYVSDVVPGTGFGGRIIIDRHLRRLADEGWRITILSPFSAETSGGPWRELRLPIRRWWWPPFRPNQPWLVRFRTWACQRELARAGVPRADAVLTITWGPMSVLAATLARAQAAPLTAIVHDWWRELEGSDKDSGPYACATAHKVFAVSAEMQAALAEECGRSVDVLFPLPTARVAPFVEWREDFRRPAVAHVGSLHPYHEPFLALLADHLASVGGRLLLLASRENPTVQALVRRGPHVVQQNPFPDNADALRWVAAQASALTVMYPYGQQKTGHPPTGFPSRFVEFSQIGLPVLLAAPPENPISSWARRHAWTSACEPTDGAALKRWVEAIANEPGWKARAAETRRAATSDFDPAAIHRQLSTALAAR